ncbi:MAG: hypothetical protein HQM11_07595 [SAR324 cluster bacterium]|nr:hypothetical protein [SAR324 cluster bacterium]
MIIEICDTCNAHDQKLEKFGNLRLCIDCYSQLLGVVRRAVSLLRTKAGELPYKKYQREFLPEGYHVLTEAEVDALLRGMAGAEDGNDNEQATM